MFDKLKIYHNSIFASSFQVECANGQIGFGRRRRRRDVTAGDSVDRNKVYEVSMSTIVKVAEEHVEGKPATWVEKGESQLDQD